jgi:hypothetical protein
MTVSRLLLACVFATVASPAFRAADFRRPGPDEFGLGLNLSGVTDWSSEIVFVDVFKAARPWISQAEGKPWGQGGPLDVDDRGHVRALRPGQFAESVVFTDFGDRFPAGVYTCSYGGDGDLDFTGDAKVIERRPGRLKVEIRPKDGSAFARITRTDSKNPLRDIRLVMPGHEATYEEKPFNPDFLSRWEDMRVFRFMDWGRTNDSPVTEWADRATPGDHSQSLRGIAPEYMIDLCNELGADGWFCMPHRATDDYVRQFARLARERLRPDLRAYVEYSNECWNGQFGQARYCAERGKELRLSDNTFEAQLRYYSQRSVEVFRLWEDEFGKGDRLVRVLAAQSANPWTGMTVLTWHDAYQNADALAVAPYFGNRHGDPKTVAATARMTPDELIAALTQDVAETRKYIEGSLAEARRHGLPLIAYEGGQHLAGHGGAENDDALTRLFQATNRHPGMKELYLQHLADWRDAGGGLYCLFSSTANSSKWGSWGLAEYLDQSPGETPKLEAVREVVRGLDGSL